MKKGLLRLSLTALLLGNAATALAQSADRAPRRTGSAFAGDRCGKRRPGWPTLVIRRPTPPSCSTCSSTISRRSTWWRWSRSRTNNPDTRDGRPHRCQPGRRNEVHAHVAYGSARAAVDARHRTRPPHYERHGERGPVGTTRRVRGDRVRSAIAPADDFRTTRVRSTWWRTCSGYRAPRTTRRCSSSPAMSPPTRRPKSTG